MNKRYLAVHKLVDFYGCNPPILHFAKYLEPVMQEAATKAGCAIIAVKSHQFNPIGATVIVLVAESHLSIHTWPEQGKALVDIFASGEVDFQAAIDHIAKAIGASGYKTTTVERG